MILRLCLTHYQKRTLPSQMMRTEQDLVDSQELFDLLERRI